MRQPHGGGALRLQGRTGSAGSASLPDLGLLLRLWLQSLSCVRKDPALCPAHGEGSLDSAGERLMQHLTCDRGSVGFSKCDPFLLSRFLFLSPKLNISV